MGEASLYLFFYCCAIFACCLVLKVLEVVFSGQLFTRVSAGRARRANTLQNFGKWPVRGGDG
jgi:hypothetical protein